MTHPRSTVRTHAVAVALHAPAVRFPDPAGAL